MQNSREAVLPLSHMKGFYVASHTLAFHTRMHAFSEARITPADRSADKLVTKSVYCEYAFGFVRVLFNLLPQPGNVNVYRPRL